MNKRHKKHEDMLALAAEARRKADKKRRVRKQEQELEQERHPGRGELHGDIQPNQQEATSANRKKTPGEEEFLASSSSANELTDRPSPLAAASQKRPKRRTAPAPFQGGRCTFGAGRGEDEGEALETLARRSMHVSLARSSGGPASSWGPEERQKLNEICESSSLTLLLLWPSSAKVVLHQLKR